MGKVYIVHHRNIVLLEKVDSSFYPVTDRLGHQCIDGPGVDEVAINALLFNDLLHGGKVLCLEFRVLGDFLDAVGRGKTPGSIVGIWFEMPA